MIIEKHQANGMELYMQNRFICIGEYPQEVNILEAGKPHYKKGDIILAYPTPDPMLRKIDDRKIYTEETIEYLERYPSLFRSLAWYEHRSIEELCSIKFVLVVTNDHPKYKAGDQVRVKDYSILTKPLKFGGYFIYDYDPYNIISVKECFPETYQLIFKNVA